MNSRRFHARELTIGLNPECTHETRHECAHDTRQDGNTVGSTRCGQSTCGQCRPHSRAQTSQGHCDATVGGLALLRQDLRQALART